MTEQQKLRGSCPATPEDSSSLRNAEMVTGGIFQVLIDPQIFLRRLNGRVTVGALNLFDACPALVSQLPERAA